MEVIASENSRFSESPELELIRIRTLNEIGEKYKSEFKLNEQVFGDVQHKRKACIDFILKISKAIKYRFRTQFLAVIYLDKYINVKPFDLKDESSCAKVAVGYLSAAAKVQNEWHPPRTMSGYLNSLDTHKWEDEELKEQERSVFRGLNWQLDAITPIELLPFFIRKLWPGSESEEEERFKLISDFLLEMTYEISVLHQFTPAVLAVAATLRAVNENLSRSILYNVEDVVSCCVEMNAQATVDPKKRKGDDLELDSKKARND